MRTKRESITIATLLSFVFLHAAAVGGTLLAQETRDDEVCPKPYIKLIKPKLARAGQQITIRGRRFGEGGTSGEVMFSPGISGHVVSWANNRITVEVPMGAKTGEVVVINACGRSDSAMMTIETGANGEKK